MRIEAIAEEIELIIEIGEAADALDLSRRLVKEGQTAWAINVRRTIVRDVLDREALRVLAGRVAEAARPAVDWGLFAGHLADVEAGLRAALTAQAATPAAERRTQSARQWTAQQRREERVRTYNEQVDRVNRERGRIRNQKQAAKVLATACSTCFQVRAANGACGC